MSRDGTGTSVVLLVFLASLTVLAALAGLLTHHAVLAAFGHGLRPMVYRTGLMTLLLGGGLLARVRWKALPARLAAGACALTVAVLALAPLLGPFGGSVPIAALGVLAAAASLALLAARPEPSWRVRQAAALAALVPLGFSAVLLFGFGAGLPLHYETAVQPPSLPISLAFFALSHALLAACGTDAFPLSLFRLGREELPRTAGRWTNRLPLLVFMGLALLVSLTGVLLARNQAETYLARTRLHLATLADNRAGEMDGWLGERFGDARTILRAELLQTAFAERLGTGRGEAGIRSWMRAQLDAYGYDRVALCDLAGRPVVAEGRPAPAADPDGALARALATGNVVLADLPPAGGGGEQFGFWVPVLDHGRPAGAVELVVDLGQYVDPFLTGWSPVPPRGVTALIHRRQGRLETYGRSWTPRAEDLERLAAPGRSVNLTLDPGDLRERSYVSVRPLARVPWVLALRIREVDRMAALRPMFWAYASGTAGAVLLVALGTGFAVRRRGARLMRERLDRERDRQALARRSTVLMQEANDIILLLDLEGRILEANRRASDAYGWTAAELVRMRARDLRAPEAEKDFQARWDSLLAKGSGVWETFHRRKDGTAFPVETSSRIVEQGGSTYVLSFLRDISERHAQAREIRHLSQLYAALGQVGQAVAWTRERDQLYQRVCGVLVDYGGLRSAWIGEVDVAGSLALAGWSGGSDHLEAFAPAEGRDLLGEVIRRGRHRILAPPGEEASAAAFPVLRGGKVTHVLGVAVEQAGFFGIEEVELLQETAVNLAFALDKLDERDARARAEAELGLAAEEQRRLEAQLQQSQKMESLGSLAGGVAHDLNNVLGAILSLASAHHENEALPAPVHQALGTIVNACIRGRDVVKSLLYFARKGLEKEGPLDLNAMVRDLAQLLAHTTLKRVKLDLDLAGDLPPILGDHGALAHALMNLCVNAVDAMPGGGTLTLRTRLEPDGGLTIAVEDTGAGMAPDVLRRAVEPFFTTKPVGKGTGLGLSMAFGTLKAHGGTLELTSQAGEGTRALMRFPASRRIQAPAPAPSAPAARDGRPRRILLVDDDELIRASVGPMLTVLGHTVDLAAGGEEALALLAGGLQPDLVVLDMNMPGMTGAEALPRILEARPGLPVILASGHSEQDVQALQAGRPNVRQLKKPFSLREIQEMLAGL